MKTKNIGVIGLGKLGICLAVLLSKCFKVFGVDASEERIREIENRDRFYEPQVNEYLEKYGRNLAVSTDYDILQKCDVVFIITQTPSLENGKFSVEYVESALRALHNVNRSCLVVVSSTVNIGDTNRFRPIHKRIAYNPEFIKQGSIVNDFENPRFVVIGAYTKEDGEEAASIWRQINGKPVFIVDPTEGEIIKLALNVSYTLGITFANMIGDLCEKFRAEPGRVLDVVYQDRRNYKPGLGYGGPCFPRDVGVLMATALEMSIASAEKFATMLQELNSGVVKKYVSEIRGFSKKRIGILGVAYKQNVPYVFESQPLIIAQKLLDDGYEVYIHDPLAEENAKQVLHGGKIRFCSSVEECVRLSEVVFIGTPNFSSVKTDRPVVNPWK